MILLKGPGGHRENQSQRQLDAHPRLDSPHRTPCHSLSLASASGSGAAPMFGRHLMNRHDAESILFFFFLDAYILRLHC